MQGHNRAVVTQALGQFLAVKGELTTLLEPTIVPQVQIAQLTDTPYLRYGIPVARTLAQAAVAAEFGYIWAQAGSGVILQVKQIRITGQAGAIACSLLLMAAANVTTVGEAARAHLLDLANDTDTWVARSSFLARGTHTTATEGTAIASIQVPATTDVLITLPDPGIFITNAAAAVGLSCSNANTAFEAAFYGKEWPQSG